MKINIPNLKQLHFSSQESTVYLPIQSKLESTWDSLSNIHVSYDESHLKETELFNLLNLSKIEYETALQPMILKNILEKVIRNDLESNNFSLKSLSISEVIKIINDTIELFKESVEMDNKIYFNLNNFYRFEIEEKIKIFLTRKNYVEMDFNGSIEIPDYCNNILMCVSWKNVKICGKIELEQKCIKGYKNYLSLMENENEKFGNILVNVSKAKEDSDSFTDDKSDNSFIKFIFKCISNGCKVEDFIEKIQLYIIYKTYNQGLIEGFEYNGNMIYYSFNENAIYKIILYKDGTIEVILLKRVK